MPLDINLFRIEKGGNPNLVRESQRRRWSNVKLVDEVIELDTQWRHAQHSLEGMNKSVGLCSKKIATEMKKSKNTAPSLESLTLTTEPIELPHELLESCRTGKLMMDSLDSLTVPKLKALSKHISSHLVPQEMERAKTLEAARDRVLAAIGNIVHEFAPVHESEEHNAVLRTRGDCTTRKPQHHVDLMEALGVMDCSERVTRMSGGRAYVLHGDLVLLHVALLHYGMSFLAKRGYMPFYPPVFMTKECMGEVAQLSDFDEQLYKVTGEGEDKYLIATSEQPLCAYHRNRWYNEEDLRVPKRYAGYSSCYRKEAGSHGRDTLGIFRVHQFDKIEQFVVCSPRDEISWAVHEEMMKCAEEFYTSLGIPYRVVDIASGALNNAAARKWDLEAWFPGSGKFRELVSCSNCTDYQSRSIGCRYGPTTRGTLASALKEHPHMLNSTLCAIPRTICCLVENYQTETGVMIPEVLRPFLPTVNEEMKFVTKTTQE